MRRGRHPGAAHGAPPALTDAGRHSGLSSLPHSSRRRHLLRSQGATGAGPGSAGHLRLRRLVAPAALAALLLAGSALAACGTAVSELKVALFVDKGGGGCGTEHGPDGKATAAPGDTVDYVLQVANVGPGDANNVHTQLDLPPDTHYQATPCIDFDPVGAIRLQAVDPQARSTSPSWGTWHLDPPSTNADGSPRRPFVSIHFRVVVGGDPGDYKLSPQASSDASDSAATGAPQALHIVPAPDIRVALTVSPSSIQRDQDALYKVTIDNFGTGPAHGVNLLISLPTGLTFTRTEAIGGNASRAGAVDPIPGAATVYYGGFVIPARSQATPGRLEVTLRAKCAYCIRGQFPASVQLTDADGRTITTADQAPLAIDAPPAVAGPTPAPPPVAPTAAPRAAPTPTPPPG